MRFFLFALVLFLCTRSVAAQATATITGVVRDSVARAPLAGAMVQLVRSGDASAGALTTQSDSSGRYALVDVPTGRYLLGFIHPVLDSLGLEAMGQLVVVDGTRATMRVDLATPSPQRLRSAACAGAGRDSGAFVIGFVRDARSLQPLPGASVAAKWGEIVLRRGSISNRVADVQATSAANGWFALCNLPADGEIALVASLAGDSTDGVEIAIPAWGALRRDLYLGPSRTVIALDSATATDSGAVTERRTRIGDGELRGLIVNPSGRPVAGAQVSVAGGRPTRTNERGEFRIGDAAFGSRMVDVRAVGYYPGRAAADVAANTPPIRIRLATLEAMLDTIRIKASRISNRQTGFDQRRRGGMGRFISVEDILRRRPFATSDLFRTMPGVRLQRNSLGQSMLLVRGGGVTNWCSPSVYIDGMYMHETSPDDIDAWVRPEDIVGVEVYTGALVPPQFQHGFSGCGAIVIWTDPQIRGRPWSMQRLLTAGIIVGIVAALSWLVGRE